MGYLTTFQSIALLNVFLTLVFIIAVYLIVRHLTSDISKQSRITNAHLEKLNSDRQMQISEQLGKIMTESELVKYLRDDKKKSDTLEKII